MEIKFKINTDIDVVERRMPTGRKMTPIRGFVKKNGAIYAPTSGLRATSLKPKKGLRVLPKIKLKPKERNPHRNVDDSFSEVRYGQSDGISKTVQDFITARDGIPDKLKQFVEFKSEDGFKEAGSRVFLSKSSKSGYALSKTGDLQSVFAHSGSNEIKSLMEHAIKNGATTLDCFDGKLPQMYERFGFVETGRDTWNDDYKPDNWDYNNPKASNNGRPDIVYMKYANKKW